MSSGEILHKAAIKAADAAFGYGGAATNAQIAAVERILTEAGLGQLIEAGSALSVCARVSVKMGDKAWEGPATFWDTAIAKLERGLKG